MILDSHSCCRPYNVFIVCLIFLFLNLEGFHSSKLAMSTVKTFGQVKHFQWRGFIIIFPHINFSTFNFYKICMKATNHQNPGGNLQQNNLKCYFSVFGRRLANIFNVNYFKITQWREVCQFAHYRFEFYRHLCVLVFGGQMSNWQ